MEFLARGRAVRARGFAVSFVLVLISLAVAVTALAPLASDFAIHRSSIAGQYAKLDAARKVGLDEGEAWILRTVFMGYAPRAASGSSATSAPEGRIAATSASGSTLERISFPGGIGIDVFVADLDYSPELFGKKGCNIPRLPVAASADEAGRYYLIRSTASDSLSQALSGEELFLVSVDHFGAVTGTRRFFYRCR